MPSVCACELQVYFEEWSKRKSAPRSSARKRKIWTFRNDEPGLNLFTFSLYDDGPCGIWGKKANCLGGDTNFFFFVSVTGGDFEAVWQF